MSDELVVPDAHTHTMIPGEASCEILLRYSFRGGYVFFPVPGCWELVATLGGVERRFVLELPREDY